MNLLKKTVLLGLTLLCAHAFAQEKITVSGVVTDAQTGEPLIAVGIFQKGTSNGVISAMDGDYVIIVPQGATLVFTSIGYEAVEKVVDGPKLDVKLKVDQMILDEAVAVGYGVQKKSSLTGSVSSVKTVDLQARGITNVNQALSGKSSGVQSYSASARPGAEPSIQVRGVGSNGASAPLYVIDGRIASGTGALNPNDIESIEVLKDGASAAIYGASAGNGVILITTKKGSGDGKISYDFQLSSQSLTNRPHLMNSEEFIDYWVDAGALTLPTVYSNWDGTTNTDWMKEIFESSLMQKHQLSFSKGGDWGQLYVPGSYTRDNGMVVGDNDTYDAYSCVINLSGKIKPWLEIGTNNVIEYTITRMLSESALGNNAIIDGVGMLPLMKSHIPYSELNDALRQYADQGVLMGDNKGYYPLLTFVKTNRADPRIERDGTTNRNRNFSISGTTYLNLLPLKWLTLTSRVSYSFGSAETYTANHSRLTTIADPNLKMGVSSSNMNNVYWQWENFASVNKNFGSHYLGAMIGQSFSENRTFQTGASAEGTNEDPGYSIDDPRFLYFAYANENTIKRVSGGEPNYTRKLAFFGRLNYSYKDRYLLQASLRADAADTSVLPKGERWGFFPAASAGWVISKEPFMESSRRWLDQLKLRASWGQNGSLASLGGYMYSRTIKKVGFYPFSDGTDYSYAYAPTVIGNDDLKWETSEQVDLGLDMAFFGNRLTLNSDWYRKETKDLIVTGVKKTSTAGFDPSPINAGSILNTGVELELGWQDSVGDFTYGIRGNLTTLKNKVLKIHENVERITGLAMPNGNVFTMFEKGQPAWYLYGYKYLGVDPSNGNAIFDTGEDGVLTPEDRTKIGKGIPDFTYGVTLNVAWKGIDLVVFGSGAQGFEIYNTYDMAPEYCYNRLHWYNEGRWSASNPTGTKPSAAAMQQNNILNSSFSVFDGSYFKIKQIQLGYTFPQKLLSKIRLSNIRLYASLENFFTFTDYIGLDPEIVGSGSTAGVDMGYYPNSKRVLFGLNITF